jgi:hypothetical protein
MQKAVELLENIKKDVYAGYIQKSRSVSYDYLYKALKKIDNLIAELKSLPRWETPEQREKRTGEKWPDNGAVYALVLDWPPMMSYWSGWKIMPYGKALTYNHRPGEFKLCIICANNDYGPPPDGWKPEEQA